jgi:hypothetical protein
VSAQRRPVAIVPAEARSWYPELLRALEEAFPVRFVGLSEGQIGEASAVIVLPGGSRPERLSVPCLVLHGPARGEELGSAFTVEMSRCAGLDGALHGQRLIEHERRPPPSIQIERGCRVLAEVAGKPVWTQRNGRNDDCERASTLPAELADHDFLRDHMAAGRFWSLLPLVHFLKRISFGLSPRTQPRHACFIIDDPNVRFSSYGYVHFPELASDARECGYHVAVATIPLDLLLPGRRAVGVFAEFRSQLSLVVHGNNHVRGELERGSTAAEADRMIGAAAARVGRFEARAGIRVERVMSPPHGRCGPETLAALFRWGFLGLAASRPFPWDGFDEHRRWRLGGWLPAQLAGGGLPVLPRYPLGASLDDLVFRAFLDQPLILYCHHADLRYGLAPLRSAAARLAELGDVCWMSLASILRANAVAYVDGGVAMVRPYSRDLRIRNLMADVVHIEIPRIFGARESVRFIVDDNVHDVRIRSDEPASITLANEPISDELRIRLDAPVPLTTVTVRDWLPRAWPLARRAMTEARDRGIPHIGDRLA